MSEIVSMTREEFEAFHKKTVKLAADEAIKTIEKKLGKESVQKSRIKVIRGKLAAYRRHKQDLLENVEFSPAEKYEYRLSFLEDLMGARPVDVGRTEATLIAMEEQRRANRFELQLIDNAVKKFCDEVTGSDDVVRARWFNVMVLFYINDEQKTMDEVADELHISIATAWRDLDKACEVLLEYIV